MFEHIAIVGRSCILPGALDPGRFWENIRAGQVSLSAVPAGRWRLNGERPDGVSTTVGGYVLGFDEVFDPGVFQVDGADIRNLDPAFRYVLYGARQALLEAGAAGPPPRAGLVLGNLSLPTDGLSAFAESIWKGKQDRPDPLNRFCSGLPAHLAAAALGLRGGGFALDAACASGLYAIKIACDRLHDRTADLMVAGAMNRTDDLSIHLAFTALSALSPSGRSRPFHRDADGLVPAEGAAFVTLMRLSDAVAKDVQIFGVIRGIGLSNDGRGAGLLVPSPDGQVRAIRQAHALAGIGPESVTMVECHATGTKLGDETEIRSLTEVFGVTAGGRPLPIGSAKSNIGHLITAAGVAGLLKVLGAMEAGVRPPSVGADEPTQALRGSGLRLLQDVEEWNGPRLAGVSAFGFGGNNAHLIVQEWTGDRATVIASASPAPVPEPVSHPAANDSDEASEIAVVAIGARVANCPDFAGFQEALLSGTALNTPAGHYDLALAGLRFPPADLMQALGQQVCVLEAAREAVAGLDLPRLRTMVLVGMGCDAEVARYPARTRAASGDKDAFAPPLAAPAVIGTMPNVVANRISSQLDIAGPGFTVSAEEASGLVALELAARALRHGEADAVLVGAVDLSYEPVHQAALSALGIDIVPGDAAIVLVLKRLSDARRDDDKILAVLTERPDPAPMLVVGNGSAETAGGHTRFDPAELFGAPHAAAGLLAVACAVISLHHGAIPRAGRPADPALGGHSVTVAVNVLGAAVARLGLRTAEVSPWSTAQPASLHVFSGADLDEVLASARETKEADTGPARLVVCAAGPQALAAKVEAAAAWLTGRGVRPEGVAFRERPVTGEVSFVYTNGSACYPRMGGEFLLAFPSVVAELEQRCGSLRDLVGWAYTGAGDAPPHVLNQIWGASFLGQAHTEVTRGLLGIEPSAVIGYSSGESGSLVAMGAWPDVPALVADARGSGLFTRQLAGEMTAVSDSWRELFGISDGQWAAYLVSAPADVIRAAIAAEPAVHLMAMNAPTVNVVGGERGGCLRALEKLGAKDAIPLSYDMAVHVPEAECGRQECWELHSRPTVPVPGVRFYSAANTDPYLASRENAANAITHQLMNTIDFAGTVERAWRDGVRVFIEHGPRGLCTGWISRVLGDREHLAVALDSGDGRSLRQLTMTVADLVAAGVQVRAGSLFAHLESARLVAPDAGATRTLPARLPAVSLSGRVEFQPTPPAPVVAPIGAQTATLVAPAQLGAGANSVMLHRGVAQAHREFLETQAQAQDRYLALARRSASTLASSGRAGYRSREPEQSSAPVLDRPVLDRPALERLASGRIADVLGSAFLAQDTYRRQVRMPMPPMLLADRVTGIDAEQGVLGTGTIWTQTDVTAEAWYLDPTGRMPVGLMIESGQADLLLISWMGVDNLNRGERVYRLLGCELTFHGSPPVPGETLDFEIHIDGHGQVGETRLFFFHQECRVGGEVRMTVRDGQAGFFTDAELASSGGVLFDPASSGPERRGPVSPPVLTGAPGSFTAEQVRAFADGRPDECFGEAWRAARAHVRTPRIAQGRMLFLHEVTEFAPAGGPWGLGYLRAQAQVSPSDWFFEGHFKDDPCMPGTLMYEGCLQAMSFYLAGLGYTVAADGWRFEPVTGHAMPMRCRGQVTPLSRSIVYEVFVSGVHADPYPTLIADVLCSVDGIKSFHAAGAGIRLVPDWPAARLAASQVPDDQRAASADGLRFGEAALLASARGKQADAFGPAYAVFDGTRHAPRLPGPPYLFMSRVVEVRGHPGLADEGLVVAEYDVPGDGWYWTEHGDGVMPPAVLMEVALQPCGWLASYLGYALSSEKDFLFRNLDGDLRLHGEVGPRTRTLRTTATLRSASRSAGMIIVSFDVECQADGRPVLSATTTFGFFPPQAFSHQAGLPATEQERSGLRGTGMRSRQFRPLSGPPGTRTAGSMLLMLDRIVDYQADGGSAGLGRVIAEKDVRPDEWFFKAHFFQDPVQPGSLGVEAIGQALRWYMVESGLAEGLASPRFESVTVGSTLKWKYRGQVTPSSDLVTVELDVLQVRVGDGDRVAVANAWLWVDGIRIYHVSELTMRLVGEQVMALDIHNTEGNDYDGEEIL